MALCASGVIVIAIIAINEPMAALLLSRAAVSLPAKGQSEDCPFQFAQNAIHWSPCQ
jgi:hypothetical protein